MQTIDIKDFGRGHFHPFIEYPFLADYRHRTLKFKRILSRCGLEKTQSDSNYYLYHCRGSGNYPG